MAKRNSRTKKNEALRTGGGRAAKAARSQRRQAVTESTTETGPKVRVRPAGGAGFAFLTLMGWLVAALMLLLGAVLGRWNVMSYPDSLWLYAAFGTVVAAPAIGRIARVRSDADSWGIQSLLIPLGLFIAELVIGPGCPTGSECAAIGARGSMGIVWSIVAILLLGAASWALARWRFSAADRVRPRHGQVRYRFAVGAVIGLLIFPGTVIAAALLGLDMWQRSTPGLAADAKTEVERECYGISNAPTLAVRAAPHGYNSKWTTFAVRRGNESRPGLGESKKLPGNWATYDEVHPYEATASFNERGEIVDVTCGRIGPDSGTAKASDLESEAPANNPLSPTTLGQQFYPRFFTQGVAGPTEEGKKLIEEREKEAAQQAKDDAKDAKADSAKDDAKDDKDSKDDK